MASNNGQSASRSHARRAFNNRPDRKHTANHAGHVSNSTTNPATNKKTRMPPNGSSAS